MQGVSPADQARGALAHGAKFDLGGYLWNKPTEASALELPASDSAVTA